MAAIVCTALAIKVPLPARVTGFIRTWSYPAGLAFFFLVVAFTVARNIPVVPFCSLAPGGC